MLTTLNGEVGIGFLLLGTLLPDPEAILVGKAGMLWERPRETDREFCRLDISGGFEIAVDTGYTNVQTKVQPLAQNNWQTMARRVARRDAGAC